MKKSEAKPGVRVIASRDVTDYGYDVEDSGEVIAYYHEGGYSDYTLVGVISEKKAEDKDCVTVEWDEDCDIGDHEEVEEVPYKVLTLESDLPQIEKEYKEAQALVKEKLKEAAKLIEEAGQIAVNGHAKDLQSMCGNELSNAMDNNGWRSSSWNC